MLKSYPPAPVKHRLAMLKIAIDAMTCFEIDEREIQRNTPSYMVETLCSLQKEFPNNALCLILGSDAVSMIEQWYAWESIFDLAHLIVVSRPHYPFHETMNLKKQLKVRQVTKADALTQSKSGKIFLFSSSALSIASSDIRKQIASHKNPKFLLPDAVLQYIYDHHLYEESESL